jgi:hypothetical protein
MALDWALENIQPEKLKDNWVYKAESSKSTIDVRILCRFINESHM